MTSQRFSSGVAIFNVASIATLFFAEAAHGATIRVPGDHRSVQAAINVAESGDVVLVSAGTYKERIRFKAGITVRSAGDDSKGKLGLKRAEITIINGDFPGAKGPGVAMAEGSTLDGFTITGVGRYDDKKWKKHHAAYGEMQSHEHIGKPGTAGVSVIGVARCTVTNNIVHHIGYTGIAIVGVKGKRVSPKILNNVCYRNMGGGIGSMKKSTASIEGNVCFQNFYAGIGHNDASPKVIGNICYENIRAGIGISEHACPIVRRNKCYKNRRAGIGIRTGAQTQPVVEFNDCFENEMAGIGNRDGARPIIRNNNCYKNKMAGIGSRDGARAVIEYNHCHENEMAGIGSRLGAAPVIRNNKCYRNKMAGIGAREKARPVIENNECYENAMAGIGSRTDAAPVVRDNRCYRNRMAGIGSRLGARPVIVDNECYENQLAGIGSREGAAPVICRNRSHHNQLAGIGTRRGARTVIVDNQSFKNQKAGIGVRDTSSAAVIVGNRCLENRLVAVGVPDGATAFIHGNELKRTGGGAPPLVAVKGGSIGVVSHNSISGGGVAGVLVKGRVGVYGNRFQGAGGRQGSAIWVWKGSTVNVIDNRVSGYRNAVNANGSDVSVTGNVTRKFKDTSIIVRKPSSPAHVYGNTAVSKNSSDKVVEVDASKQSASANVVRTPDKFNQSTHPKPPIWPLIGSRRPGSSYHPLNGSGRRVIVRNGPWKLVVIFGKSTRYELYDAQRDPKESNNLSRTLEQVVFRLKGLLERREGQAYQREMRPRSGR